MMKMHFKNIILPCTQIRSCRCSKTKCLLSKDSFSEGICPLKSSTTCSGTRDNMEYIPLHGCSLLTQKDNSTEEQDEILNLSGRSNKRLESICAVNWTVNKLRKC